MMNYANWFNHTLSLASMFFMVMAVFSTSVMNVLLCTVLMVLLQSMVLIKLEMVVVGSLMMMMYFGAMVMLFSFMVLFLGQMNWEKKTKKYNPLTVLTVMLLVVHLSLMVNFPNSKNHPNSCIKANNTNQNEMKLSSGNLEVNLEEYSILSEIMYGQLMGILVLITLVLGLALVLMLLMMNPPKESK